MVKYPNDRGALRVVLVQQDPLLRRDIRSALTDGAIEVVAETGALERAIPLVTASFPDVVVMDMDWPGVAALDMCKSLVGEIGVGGILATTRRCEDATLLRSALAAGVRGYVAKSTDTTEVVGAVKAIADGSMVVGHAAAQLMAGLLRATDRPAGPGLRSALTRRELEVLELVARGYDNRRIARCLTLADKTVRNHVSAILGKIGASSRTQAVVRAREAGFGLAY
ncbi:LuxR C-terminal-related transcriptional regulator [Streptomyces sp. NPDC018693]|uniref:LuxR C-terminal-related transcriptional regulator n=1 Tax=unclassified Streptomyces TaxID=2593676 RepID=UPI0037B21C0C